MSQSFEWDPAKATSNERKHGVRFELAMRVFLDPLAVTRQDRIEGGERRWQTIGMVDGMLLLLVAHTVREDEDEDVGEVIRIVSARLATRKEKRDYEQENG